MHKKLITACLALVALAAFALPAAAQATNNPLVTHPTGKALAVPAQFKATNVGEMLFVDTIDESKVLFRCTVATLTGELTKNETGNVQGNITSASFTGTGGGAPPACTGVLTFAFTPLSLPWSLKATNTMETDEFQVRGGSLTEVARKIKFLLKPTIGGECEYESTTTIAAKGTFTTHSSGDAVLSIPRVGHKATEDAGFTKVKDTTFLKACPESFGLKMAFTFETDTTPAAEPFYISE